MSLQTVVVQMCNKQPFPLLLQTAVKLNKAHCFRADACQSITCCQHACLIHQCILFRISLSLDVAGIIGHWAWQTQVSPANKKLAVDGSLEEFGWSWHSGMLCSLYCCYLRRLSNTLRKSTCSNFATPSRNSKLRQIRATFFLPIPSWTPILWAAVIGIAEQF